MSDDAFDARRTELEVRLAFIDDAVHALTSVDADQSMRIAALERMVRELRSELATVRSGGGQDAQSEPPPPHY